MRTKLVDLTNRNQYNGRRGTLGDMHAVSCRAELVTFAIADKSVVHEGGGNAAARPI